MKAYVSKLMIEVLMLVRSHFFKFLSHLKTAPNVRLEAHSCSQYTAKAEAHKSKLTPGDSAQRISEPRIESKKTVYLDNSYLE